MDKTKKIQVKLLDVVTDALEVAHATVKGEKYKGRTISRIQSQTALQVIRLANTIDLSQATSGIVVNIGNIPRPKRADLKPVEDIPAIDAENPTKEDDHAQSQ